jgi:transposase
VILVKKYIKKGDEIKMAYNEIYRSRALAYKKNGDTFKELYEVFKITARTYYQWVELEQSTGGLAYSTSPGRPREINREALRHAVEAKPGLYLREYAAALGCSISVVEQTFKEERMTLKKKRSLIRKALRRSVSISEPTARGFRLKPACILMRAAYAPICPGNTGGRREGHGLRAAGGAEDIKA